MNAHDLRDVRGEALTPREAQIARLTAQELSNRQIAYKLGLAPQTIKNAQTTLRRKLGIETRVGVALAVQRGEV